MSGFVMTMATRCHPWGIFSKWEGEAPAEPVRTAPQERRPPNRLRRLVLKQCLVWLLFSMAIATAPEASAQPTSSASTVVARVNGEAIYAIEVQQQLKLVLRGREAQPMALRLLQAQATEQLIGRRLILQMLAEKKLAANEREIDLEVQRIRKQLAVTGVTLEEHLKKSEQDLASLQRNLAWQMSWQRYLDRYMNEANLQKFYGPRRREFDGTELRVAHILLKVEKIDDAQAVAKMKQQAAEIRAKIVAGETTFDAAAAEFSQSPTAKSGGKIGFITRHDSMPEAFAKAAFQLEEGEVSPPVLTPFGVHLIKCLEIKPGQRPWDQIEGEVRLAATQYLFDWIVAQRRPDAAVEYTGSLPYFKPGTREVVQ